MKRLYKSLGMLTLASGLIYTSCKQDHSESGFFTVDGSAEEITHMKIAMGYEGINIISEGEEAFEIVDLGGERVANAVRPTWVKVYDANRKGIQKIEIKSLELLERSGTVQQLPTDESPILLSDGKGKLPSFKIQINVNDTVWCSNSSAEPLSVGKVGIIPCYKRESKTGNFAAACLRIKTYGSIIKKDGKVVCHSEVEPFGFRERYRDGVLRTRPEDVKEIVMADNDPSVNYLEFYRRIQLDCGDLKGEVAKFKETSNGLDFGVCVCGGSVEYDLWQEAEKLEKYRTAWHAVGRAPQIGATKVFQKACEEKKAVESYLQMPEPAVTPPSADDGDASDGDTVPGGNDADAPTDPEVERQALLRNTCSYVQEGAASIAAGCPCGDGAFADDITQAHIAMQCLGLTAETTDKDFCTKVGRTFDDSDKSCSCEGGAMTKMIDEKIETFALRCLYK